MFIGSEVARSESGSFDLGFPETDGRNAEKTQRTEAASKTR